MTGLFTKQLDEWHLTLPPQANVDGVWLPCKAVFANVDGQWHRVYGRVAEIIPFPTRRYWTEGVQQDVCISAA